MTLTQIYRGLQALADGGDEPALAFCDEQVGAIVQHARARMCTRTWDPADDAFLVLSPQMVVLDVNLAVLRHTGRNRGEIVGSSILDLVPPERQQQRRDLFLSVVELGRPVQFACRTAWGMMEARLEPQLVHGACRYVVLTMRRLTVSTVPWRHWEQLPARHGVTVVE